MTAGHILKTSSIKFRSKKQGLTANTATKTDFHCQYSIFLKKAREKFGSLKPFVQLCIVKRMQAEQKRQNRLFAPDFKTYKPCFNHGRFI
jgi:hypothetical protein